MKTVLFDELPHDDREILRLAVERLSRSLNKVTNPRTCAVVRTTKGEYFGNNIFLSNCTLACAEANALSAAMSAGDYQVLKVYLAVGRDDGEEKIISPCGDCRQWIHDFARLNADAVIEIFSTTGAMREVLLTDSNELLPEGFKSAGLGRMVA